MNRKWIIPLIAAAAAGVLAYGLTRHAVCGCAEPSLDRLQDVSFLTRELKLSDAQANEIKSLHASLGAKLNDCCARHCAARARLGQALATETNGAAQTEAVLAEMCRAYEASERATLEHMRRVRALLTPLQQAQYDRLVRRCVCGCNADSAEAPCAAARRSHRAGGENP